MVVYLSAVIVNIKCYGHTRCVLIKSRDRQYARFDCTAVSVIVQFVGGLPALSAVGRLLGRLVSSRFGWLVLASVLGSYRIESLFICFCCCCCCCCQRRRRRRCCSSSSSVPAGSPSRGGDVVVYVFDKNQLS